MVKEEIGVTCETNNWITAQMRRRTLPMHHAPSRLSLCGKRILRVARSLRLASKFRTPAMAQRRYHTSMAPYHH
jgi:hypothetical protein